MLLLSAALWRVWGWHPNVYIYTKKFIFSTIKIYFIDLYLLSQTYYHALFPTSFHNLLLLYLSNLYPIFFWLAWLEILVQILPCLPCITQENKSPLYSTLYLFVSPIPQCLAHTVWQLLSNSCSVEYVNELNLSPTRLLSKCYWCWLNRPSSLLVSHIFSLLQVSYK